MRKLIISLLILSMIVFPACDSANDETGYLIYYTNAKYSEISEMTYQLKNENEIEAAKELFNVMKNINVTGGISVIPASIDIDTVSKKGDILNLYLKGNYSDLSSAEKLILCASLTKSISQLGTISGIDIYCNDEQVKDDNGQVIGIMKPARFVNNAFYHADDYKEEDIIVYFANKTQDKLIKSSVKAKYRSSVPIERVVVEKIIAGPNNSELMATVSSSLTLLSINVRDEICYVNFDDKFITDEITGHDDVSVYSVVNSLMELPGINSVQISINGEPNIKMPQGEISFDKPFTYNEFIVE